MRKNSVSFINRGYKQLIIHQTKLLNYQLNTANKLNDRKKLFRNLFIILDTIGSINRFQIK